MPRKKARRKKPEEEHTFLAIVVNQFDIDIGASVNHNVLAPQYAWFYSDDDPLFEATTRLKITGTCTYPDHRAGDTYNITIYGDDSPSRAITATLKDAQVKDKYGAPKYRTYRGRDIPVYEPPKGLSVLDKIRGEPEWSAWINVVPRLVSDMLVLLGQDRQKFVSIHERKVDRKRWIQGINLQTTDPAEE